MTTHLIKNIVSEFPGGDRGVALRHALSILHSVLVVPVMNLPNGQAMLELMSRIRQELGDSYMYEPNPFSTKGKDGYWFVTPSIMSGLVDSGATWDDYQCEDELSSLYDFLGSTEVNVTFDETRPEEEWVRIMTEWLSEQTAHIMTGETWTDKLLPQLERKTKQA